MNELRPATRRAARLAILSAALLALPASSQAQGVTIALEGDGLLRDLWYVDEATLEPEPVLEGLLFQDLALVGHAPYEALRLDRPGPRVGAELAAAVRLPGGGSLWRAAGPPGVGLLHVDASGRPRFHALLGAGELLPQVHVSADGRRALVASTLDSGGDVFLVELDEQGGGSTLTAALPPLGIDPTSLRVAPGVAWFVAEGSLYRALGEGPAAPVGLGLTAEQRLVGELVLAAVEGSVVALVDGAQPGRCDLLAVRPDGTVQQVNEITGPYDAPSYAEPLGPFVAVSDDGARVAFRATVWGDHELLVRELGDPAPPVLVTQHPRFTYYIDNIGVVGFLDPERATFIAGDTDLGNVDPSLQIGAADVYAVDFAAGDELGYFNVTQTSGQLHPPFTLTGSMVFAEARLDPLGGHVLAVAEDELGRASLSAFPLVASAEDPQAGVTTLLSELGERPVLFAGGQRVVVVERLLEEPDDDDLLTRLHSVEADPGLPEQLVLLAEFSDDFAVDRLASAPGGRWVAFVASEDEEEARPWRVDLETGLAWDLSLEGDSVELSAELALTPSGALFFGLSEDEEPMRYHALLPAFGGAARQGPVLIELPRLVGEGTPLGL